MIATTLLLLCGSGVTVVLPAEAQSTGLEISVDEIAQVQGDDQDVVARIREASLGYAPAPGYHRTLRADLLHAALRRSFPEVDLTFAGSPRCVVSCATTTIDGATITAEASKALRASLAGADAEARPILDLPDLIVPAASSAPRLVVSHRPDLLFPGTQEVPVEIWIGERLYRTVRVRFTVTIWQRQAVLKQAVPAGTQLIPAMFKVVRTPVTTGGGLQTLELPELSGAVANRALAGGSPVQERDVKRVTLVKRGDLVQVVVRSGGVVVKDVGEAQSNGRMGERVRVVLRSSGRELLAVVRGAKSLEVKLK
ncbi:MAG: flagellar basal body P-ring formation chaperone FlgA [Planctomycetota bacterium]|jgi:flagella basal body P-ring formation protein FlgA